MFFTDELWLRLTRGDGQMRVFFEGMSITLRPVHWSGIDLEVEGPSWSGAVCHSINGLSLLSLLTL